MVEDLEEARRVELAGLEQSRPHGVGHDLRLDGRSGRLDRFQAGFDPADLRVALGQSLLEHEPVAAPDLQQAAPSSPGPGLCEVAAVRASQVWYLGRVVEAAPHVELRETGLVGRRVGPNQSALA